MVLSFILIELAFLFLTARIISQALFSISYKIFRKESIAARIVAFIFFPGTLIHELAHYAMAKILFVRTGKIELVPKLHGDGLKLGSVQIAKTDIFRRFLIGVAPLIFGLVLLCIISYYVLPVIIGFEFSTKYFLLSSLYTYTLFVVTNTMFSSKKDMEGAFGLLIFVLFVLAVIFVAGKGEWVIALFDGVISNVTIQKYSNRIAVLLLVPVVINLLALSVFKLRKRS